jgi:lysophospholipase L1-like esterase
MQKNDKERDEHFRPTKLGGRFREAFSIRMFCVILGLGLLPFAGIFANFELPAGTLHEVKAQAQAPASSPGTQGMVTVEPGSAPSPVADTLVLNGSFENGFADWGNNGWGSWGRPVRFTSGQYSGTGGLRFAAPGSLSQAITNRITPEHTYKLSFYARVSAPGEKAYAGVMFLTADGSINGNPNLVITSTSYQLYSISFIANQAATVYVYARTDFPSFQLLERLRRYLRQSWWSPCSWFAGLSVSRWICLPSFADFDDFQIVPFSPSPTAPTVSLSASPSTVASGENTVLTWTSNNATSCTGMSFPTNGAISGSVTVSATRPTVYSVFCVGPEGNANRTVGILPSNSRLPQLGTLLPLGDSLTYGYVSDGDPHNDDGGYRRYLWDDIAAIGLSCTTNFVGPLQTGVVTSDRDHEGHGNWRTDQLLPLIRPDMDTYNPNIVLMQAGGNDIVQGASVSTALNGLASMLDAIYAAKPDVKVYVFSYPGPRQNNIFSSTWNATSNRQLTSGLRSLVSQRAAAGKKIQFVDMAEANLDTSLNSTDFGQDGVHLSPQGYKRIADVLFNALINDRL